MGVPHHVGDVELDVSGHLESTHRVEACCHVLRGLLALLAGDGAASQRCIPLCLMAFSCGSIEISCPLGLRRILSSWHVQCRLFWTHSLQVAECACPSIFQVILSWKLGGQVAFSITKD